jgi:hypothetical protein
MTTPQFIAWLDGKMAPYGKLIPPPEVLEGELAKCIEDKVRAAVSARILREAGLKDQVTATVARITTPAAAALANGIELLFKREPDRQWRDHIEAVSAIVLKR